MTGRWAVVAWLWCVLNSLPAGAQMGGVEPDWDALAALKEWEPEATGYMESFSADLRPQLPPVGKQSMGDCVAWAFGYAAKSYLEAIDQGWKPDRPARIFSPRFLYNQCNKGKDTGSTGFDVLTLLQTKGCATLATCPYVPKDFTGQPEARAFEEARLFKVSTVYVVKDDAAMRTALSQGQIVMVGVRTNPVFNSGTYDVYTVAKHNEGRQRRRPGQKHGFHAMAVVGFDDRKQAFLFMNSWGTDWGQRGFCWVSYEAARKRNSKEVESELIDYALVPVDVKQRVDVGPDGIAMEVKPDRNSIEARVTGQYRGWNGKTLKQQYMWVTWLTGHPKALDLVQNVEWTVAGEATGKPLTGVDRLSGFRTIGVSPVHEVTLEGLIRFKDGATMKRSATLKLPKVMPDNREIELAIQDRYWGKIVKDGKESPAWWWDVRVAGNPRDLEDIASVSLDASEMDGQPAKLEFDAKTATQLVSRFGTSGVTTQAKRIWAVIKFKDGGSRIITLFPKFWSPADETFRLASRYVEEGNDNEGKAWYSWTVEMHYPWKEQGSIQSVVYRLGPTQQNQELRREASMDFYPVHGSSQGEFRVDATVTFKDGSTKELTHQVTLGQSSAVTKPAQGGAGK